MTLIELGWVLLVVSVACVVAGSVAARAGWPEGVVAGGVALVVAVLVVLNVPLREAWKKRG